MTEIRKLFMLCASKGFFFFAACVLFPGWHTSASLAKVKDPDGNACVQAIKEAEEHYNLPHGILMALSITESSPKKEGKPHPWAIGTPTRSYYPASKKEALKLVNRLRTTGQNNIDVGCLQINLKAHPKAFKNLEMALDPLHNVAYGVHYLTTLRNNNQPWPKAIGNYHSKNERHNKPYKQKVLTLWKKRLLKTHAKLKITLAKFRHKNPTPSFGSAGSRPVNTASSHHQGSTAIPPSTTSAVKLSDKNITHSTDTIPILNGTKDLPAYLFLTKENIPKKEDDQKLSIEEA